MWDTCWLESDSCKCNNRRSRADDSSSGPVFLYFFRLSTWPTRVWQFYMPAEQNMEPYIPNMSSVWVCNYWWQFEGKEQMVADTGFPWYMILGRDQNNKNKFMDNVWRFYSKDMDLFLGKIRRLSINLIHRAQLYQIWHWWDQKKKSQFHHDKNSKTNSLLVTHETSIEHMSEWMILDAPVNGLEVISNLLFIW